MQIDKQDYFNLLNDSFKYKANQDVIDAYLNEGKKREAKEFFSEISWEVPEVETVEIPDEEYARLKTQSERLEQYECDGNLLADLFALSFQSYKQMYENERDKVWKLKEAIMSMAKDSKSETVVRSLLDKLI